MNLLETNIFNIRTELDFISVALQIFEYQYNNNNIYRRYCDLLKKSSSYVKTFDDIPFLPVSLFKTHRVITGTFEPQRTFFSSGTTESEPSQHHIKDLALYEKSFLQCFQKFYGDISAYTFLALLPNYMENPHSSLIYMIDFLMALTGNFDSGYYLHQDQQLYHKLSQLKARGSKTILFGVSYALLDFAEHYHIDFPELILFETGGMKGRHKELVKEELHAILKAAFGVPTIHSEYGSCELLSQAYSKGDNVFQTPEWMKLLLRDEKNPLFHSESLTSGFINVIDLANIHSCAFIATDDIGKKHSDGGVEILGRMDNAEIRGCNLLIM